MSFIYLPQSVLVTNTHTQQVQYNYSAHGPYIQQSHCGIMALGDYREK